MQHFTATVRNTVITLVYDGCVGFEFARDAIVAMTRENANLPAWHLTIGARKRDIVTRQLLRRNGR